MRRYPLPDVLRDIEPSGSPWLRLSDEEIAQAVQVAEAVCYKLRLPSTCLYRALSRWALLRWQARDAQFVIGIDLGRAGEEAHAWVEQCGCVFLEQLRPGLVVVYRHPSDGRA